MMDEQQFWDSTPSLRYVFDYARASRVSPWGLLMTTLARIAVEVPPHVVTEPLTGGQHGSLNLFVALVGSSGAGKGVTTQAARMLVPDIRNAVTAQPASGESIPAMFVDREMHDEDGKQVCIPTCANCRAYMDIPEIATLGGNSKRQGSILIPMLTSAWSGEDLGCFTKNEANRYTVPQYGYRLSLVTGVQPANLGVLTGEDGTGLPQRFLWAPMTDIDAPDNRPQVPQGSFPFDVSTLPEDMLKNALDALYRAGSLYNMIDHGRTGYPLVEVQYPETAKAEADRTAVKRLHGEIKPLDSHHIGLKTKVAALLAMLNHSDNPLAVTEQDWQLAEYVCLKSEQFRDDAIRQANAIKRKQKADTIDLDDEARIEADNRKMDRVKTSILNYLAKHDPKCEGVKGYEIRRALGRKGLMAYDAIETLYSEGRLDTVDPEGKTSSRRWTLPVGKPSV